MSTVLTAYGSRIDSSSGSWINTANLYADDWTSSTTTPAMSSSNYASTTTITSAVSISAFKLYIFYNTVSITSDVNIASTRIAVYTQTTNITSNFESNQQYIILHYYSNTNELIIEIDFLHSIFLFLASNTEIESTYIPSYIHYPWWAYASTSTTNCIFKALSPQWKINTIQRLRRRGIGPMRSRIVRA